LANKALLSVFLALGKKTSLPSVFYLTLGKAFFAECRDFAECFLFGSRKAFFAEHLKKMFGKASYARQKSGFRQ
jgi:hypothetical protein